MNDDELLLGLENASTVGLLIVCPLQDNSFKYMVSKYVSISINCCPSSGFRLP